MICVPEGVQVGESDEAGAGFLAQFELRPVALEKAQGLRPVGLALGQGARRLEVVVTEVAAKPAATTLRSVWKQRQANRAVPMLLVALYADRAALCGPAGEQPQTYLDLGRGLVECLCAAALREPDRHAALRFLNSALPEIESPLPGLRNQGLLATHELEAGVPKRPDWQRATASAQPALAARGQDLMRALGFEIQPLAGQAHLLLAGRSRRAVAVLLGHGESADLSSDRFSGTSPVSYGLHQAEEAGVPYLIVAAGPLLRLYSTDPDIGTGRRGRTETFVEAHLDLLPSDRAGYLSLLFSAEALTRGGTFEDILNRSADYAAELGGRLRDRVYERVVPPLAAALAAASRLRKPTAEALAQTYEMTLALLFRLLFVAYAEDTDRLPYRVNTLYRARSLKQKARDLLEVTQKQIGFDTSTSHWNEVNAIFSAVDAGKPREWGVPAYNGQLFSNDPDVWPLGAALEKIALSNNVFGPILAELLLDKTLEGGRGPVDFRSLGVREFGTIYEGLLENELAVAEADLALERERIYKPATGKAKVAVRAGQVYLHTASGERKATGSYFTKPFAVAHLLDHALEPALEAHLKRLDEMDDQTAGRRFFEFRVADIAMGSGHFLVAAVDRIEPHFSNYLRKRPLEAVNQELERLRAAAAKAMGLPVEDFEIERTQLLRRQIARRCIYGVDLNPIAVQLARVSVWIHTFVPGLPLSFLDRNLVCGNSLVGIATMEEARQIGGDLALARPGQVGLSAGALNTLLEDCLNKAEQLARQADKDLDEIKQDRRLKQEAEEGAKSAKAVFDILAATYVSPELKAEVSLRALDWEGPEALLGSPIHKRAQEVMKAIRPFHFPIAFPEVFLRHEEPLSPGFDCILGNPPWEEATVEEDRFWNRHFPGLNSLPQREKEAAKRKYRRDRPDLVAAYEREVQQAELLREVLTSGPFPGMGTGDPDHYKAFCWRFWHLLRQGGTMGVVLPRSAWAAKGSQEFREHVFAGGTAQDLTFLLNRGGWVFDDAEPRYTITLTALSRERPTKRAAIGLRGPYASPERYRAGVGPGGKPHRFKVSEVLEWTDTAALPLLPAEESAEVFAQLRKAPRLDLNDGTSWRARPHTELHATNDKKLMDLRSKDCPKAFWPVFKGESFDIWNPDTGSYYAWANPDDLIPHLWDKRIRARKNRGSPFSEFPLDWTGRKETLPCYFPRIAFHDVERATDTRTVKAALVPPEVFITNSAPFLLWPRGDAEDEAFLLGVLCSLPLDWYARRFVELHVNYHVFNPLPVPRPERKDPLWQRTVALAGRLASPDDRFAKWAEAVGVECGPVADDEKQDMIHELDAVVAHLYGLSEAHLRHIFETFHEGWDYEERLQATLEHFTAWGKQLR